MAVINHTQKFGGGGGAISDVEYIGRGEMDTPLSIADCTAGDIIFAQVSSGNPNFIPTIATQVNLETVQNKTFYIYAHNNNYYYRIMLLKVISDGTISVSFQSKSGYDASILAYKLF